MKNADSPMRIQGTVKWWNIEKGYGFAVTSKGEEIFLHYSDLENSEDRQILTEGYVISFEIGQGSKGPMALKIRNDASDINTENMKQSPNFVNFGNSSGNTSSSNSHIRKLSVFLCHSSNDKEMVRTIYYRLINDGIDPWLDEEKILPGQDWQQEINKAVKTTDVVIVCLSGNSISKRGFVQKEIKYALDIAEEQPDGTIFLIPLKLEECDVPERLQRWQWVNYFDVRGYNRLKLALEERADTLGVTPPVTS